jgi:hypothetical protein
MQEAHLEKILAWAILTAVLFFLVVTVAMLSGVPVNDGGRSWLVEGVPNWMQGIGTLAELTRGPYLSARFG